MPVKQFLKGVFRNPLSFGILAGILVFIFNISLVALIGGSLDTGISVFEENGVYSYIIPLAVGVQMGLFRHHRNITSESKLCGSEKVGIAGSATSTVSMAVCCLHHVTELVPAFGFFLATTSFLTEYKDAIIMAGLLANVAGSVYIARAIVADGGVIAGADEE